MHFINNQWIKGHGKSFDSVNPATGTSVWNGKCADRSDVDKSIKAARLAFPVWAKKSIQERIDCLTLFNEELKKNRVEIQHIISKEMGKPLWEADSEMGAAISKLSISIEAYHDRCRIRIQKVGEAQLFTHHKPHGVVGVLGPFNFPAHLPNGHIVPALLAGNTVVFKPSEHTPWVAQKIVECWEKARLPAGVINMVQGGVETGILLSQHLDIDGLMFTGSFKTGLILSALYAKFPQKMLVLEMGGNNPFLVHQPENIPAAVYNTLLSAFITSGQRCTCARRLIVTKGAAGEAFVEKLIIAMQQCTTGPYTNIPEPFMGSLVSKEAASQVLSAYEALVARGGIILVPMIRKNVESAFLTPALIDVTSIPAQERDIEIFGPLLQLSWVNTFSDAIQEANRTEYGLAAGLLCEDEALYQQFYSEVRAGIVNWNKPLTGASSRAPFGGVGKSGNHRPSAYYAADYCAYPVASLEKKELTVPEDLIPALRNIQLEN